MAGSGSENRRRQKIRGARFSDEEAALIDEQAAKAGITVGDLIRYAVLGMPPLRANRRPSIEDEAAARIIANLGLIASSLRGRSNGGGPVKLDPEIEAACRDIAEMRAVLFQALGRDP